MRILLSSVCTFVYIAPYTSRSTKFSGKINDQEATFVFVFVTDSILVWQRNSTKKVQFKHLDLLQDYNIIKINT